MYSCVMYHGTGHQNTATESRLGNSVWLLKAVNKNATYVQSVLHGYGFL